MGLLVGRRTLARQLLQQSRKSDVGGVTDGRGGRQRCRWMGQLGVHQVGETVQVQQSFHSDAHSALLSYGALRSDPVFLRLCKEMVRYRN
jgi:hypothetical protein